MNDKLASSLTIVSTAAAALALAAASMGSGNAYADDITIDPTPFVSTRTRAEVQAEIMGQAEVLRGESGEWAMQQNVAAQPSTYTSAQAKAEYIAARREVNALNAEDSGSSYFASLPRREHDRVIMAGSHD
jgi:hypothetical protein